MVYEADGAQDLLEHHRTSGSRTQLVLYARSECIRVCQKAGMQGAHVRLPACRAVQSRRRGAFDGYKLSGSGTMRLHDDQHGLAHCRESVRRAVNQEQEG